MSNNKKLTRDINIINELSKIKMPIIDQKRNLKIYFKEQSRSNETGIEHIAKNYHNLTVEDIKMLTKGIQNPFKHSKDKRYNRTYYYYYKRKHDKKNYVKVVVNVKRNDFNVGFISSMYVTSKIK